MYCTYRPESKIRYKKFLLEIAREWITVVSKECSTAPDTSVRSQTAPSKDSPSRLSGQLKDYVLEKIVSARRTNPTKACRVRAVFGPKKSECLHVGGELYCSANFMVA
ncbi:hypothetical protein M0802_014457 [Mischocyttarus mexicanus]|nr:hypothetical protein M0802_014457 [Mischocyttarus mexicanus]